MKKCRYLGADEIGPLATKEQQEILLAAVSAGRIQVSGTALRHLIYVWKMEPDAFIQRVLDHLKTGCLVLQKREKTSGRLLVNKFQASVWIREPDDEDDYDDGTVYVEFVIRNNSLILIFDSHEHERDLRRIPRII